MSRLPVRKLSPKADSSFYIHPSALWAFKECPALQIYRGRDNPQAPLRWQVILDRSAALQIPAWIEHLALSGTRSPTDPDVTRLFPGHSFASLSEAREALDLARSQAEHQGALGELLP